MKITIKELKQLIKEAINEPVVGNPHKSLSPEKMDQIDQKHDEPGRKAYYRDGINQKAMSYAKDAIALNPNLDLDVAYRTAQISINNLGALEDEGGRSVAVKWLVKQTLGPPAIKKKTWWE